MLYLSAPAAIGSIHVNFLLILLGMAWEEFEHHSVLHIIIATTVHDALSILFLVYLLVVYSSVF